MRPVQLGQPANDNDKDWIRNSLFEIERASQEETEAIFDDYAVSNYTINRTLDVTGSTDTEFRNFLATMIIDFQNRGRR